MAFDTAEKRFAMIAFGDGDQMLFEPDGAVDADNRWHVLGLFQYTLVVIPTDTPGIEFRLPDGRLHFTFSDNRLHFTVPDGRIQFQSKGTD